MAYVGVVMLMAHVGAVADVAGRLSSRSNARCRLSAPLGAQSTDSPTENSLQQHGNLAIVHVG